MISGCTVYEILQSTRSERLLNIIIRAADRPTSINKRVVQGVYDKQLVVRQAQNGMAERTAESHLLLSDHGHHDKA